MLLNRGRRHDDVLADVYKRTPRCKGDARFFLQPALLLSFEFIVQPLRLKVHLHQLDLLFSRLQTQPLSTAVERDCDLCGDACVQRRVVLLASPDRLVIQNLAWLIDLAVRYRVALWVVGAH